MAENRAIKVGVCGALGRMGQSVVKAVSEQPDLQLVATIDIEDNLTQALADKKPDVVIDFTAPHVVKQNALTVLNAGIRSVIGTTGLGPSDFQELEQAAKAHQSAVLVAPNFAIGAVLLMKFAKEASRYFDHAEIIELHHNQKLDAPSGTALRTAQLMAEAQPKFGCDNADDHEILPGSRGGHTESNLHIHSVRLPGLVAHQEVIFGGLGQTLTIRHDSLDRTSFMPGVIEAVRKIMTVQGFYYGLETLL